MADLVVRVHDEDGAAFNAQLFDQGAVVGTARSVHVIREHLDLVDAEGPTPALLRERKVHADGDDIDAGKTGGLFIEALGLRVADGRIERGHHADDAHVRAGIFQGDRLEAGGYKVENGR